jgi:CrcB protein
MSGVLLWSAVGVLGGLAAIGRFLVDRVLSLRLGAPLALATLLVNLSGALVLGVLVGAGVTGDAYLLTGTAIVGSYTTFSTWMLETHELAGNGQRVLAVANVLLSLLLGIGAVALGRMLAGR